MKQVQAKLKLTGIESIYLVAVSHQESMPCNLIEVMQPSRRSSPQAHRSEISLQSGEEITKLADLQDIDELHVVEVYMFLPVMLCRCSC